MKGGIITTALALASQTAAFWRMPCRGRTGLARMDPLVDPGQVAGHVHTFHGGGNIDFDTTFENLTANGSCSSCQVPEDRSAYWTPAMYFMYDNGTTVLVPQVGGMLAYYLFYNDDVKPFPEGFRMLAGDKYLRSFKGEETLPLSFWPTDPSDQFFLEQRALGFNCLNYDADPEPSLYRHKMPNKAHMDQYCKDGLRLELGFPSCGSGDLDSDDHRSHVKYPNLMKQGNCPEGYDIHYPFLFYETIWATNMFAGEAGEFTLSYGDPTGFGYHGDFIMGWESEDYLQSAINECGTGNTEGRVEGCSVFNPPGKELQSDDEMGQCGFQIPERIIDDDVAGPCEGLPVDVPVQRGPERATEYKVAGRMGNPTTAMESPQSSSTSAAKVESSPTPEASSKDSPAAYGSDASAASSHSSEDALVSPEAATTAAPSIDDADSENEIVATSYITSGNQVMELFIAQEDVYVTATTTEYETAAPGSYAKRHLHQHQHQHGVHH